MGFTKEKICILKHNKQLDLVSSNLKIIEWKTDYILLSNNIKLEGKREKRLFYIRLHSIVFCSVIDRLYSIYNYLDRDKLAKEIKAEYSSIKNLEYWESLSDNERFQKSEHMRNIVKLVDRQNIKHAIPWNKGKTKNNDSRLLKNSKDRTGTGNPMYGSIMSEEEKQKKSVLIKSRIKSGEWTPHIHNSRTHFTCSYNGKKYRSSWETIYAYLNPIDLYEKIRIEYQFNGNNHIYIVDFVNYETKVLTELKPLAHYTNLQFQSKQKAAEYWCKVNGYTYRILNEEYMYNNYYNIDFSKIDIPNKNQKLRKIRDEANKKNRNIKTKHDL